MLSKQIPSGFYSVILDKKLKELFVNIPTLDELHSMGAEGFKADVILVDAKKDKKLFMLKQLIVALVKGMNSNPAAVIKKTAGLISDFYKRPNLESPAKAALEEASHVLENQGVQLLGQIRHGSSYPRAILFKVLADSVGLGSRLMVGLPNDGIVDCALMVLLMEISIYMMVT